MPRVLNMRDLPDGVPDGAIYCGRPMPRRHLSGSPFANPFRLRRNATDTERTECIAMYERWLMMQPALRALLHTIAGRDLACWCAPLPCHCDVLLRLANGETRE
jgi:Domain of unknown function (DUF4326)